LPVVALVHRFISRPCPLTKHSYYDNISLSRGRAYGKVGLIGAKLGEACDLILADQTQRDGLKRD
jgi:hypothetical protein